MIFAIETSCDETSTAILNFKGRVLSHIVVSQKDHQKFGGVVPEIASRAHLEILQRIIPKTFKVAGIKNSSIKVYCATCGPGLIGGLLVGSTIAKSMAIANKKPFYPINHLEGHALSVQINDHISFPYLLLLITGGHTQIYLVKDIFQYKLLGSTIDDSVGETFDKAAKMMGMQYPGGKNLEIKAREGKGEIKLPRPLINSLDCNFSFSGLKTAVKLHLDKNKRPTSQFINDMCSSFQKAVIDVLIKKTENALAVTKKKNINIKNFVIAGGVAANLEIKKSFDQLCKKNELRFYSPPKKLCGDNAAMIGWACLQRYKKGFPDDINFVPRPRWNLENIKIYKKSSK